MNDLNPGIRQKFLTAHKVYLTHRDIQEKMAYMVRIQFPTKEFSIIDLREPFPSEIKFKSLSPNGFNYDEKKDDPIITYGKKETLKILSASKNYLNNDPDTIEALIVLLNECKNFY